MPPSLPAPLKGLRCSQAELTLDWLPVHALQTLAIPAGGTVPLARGWLGLSHPWQGPPGPALGAERGFPLPLPPVTRLNIRLGGRGGGNAPLAQHWTPNQVLSDMVGVGRREVPQLCPLLSLWAS